MKKPEITFNEKYYEAVPRPTKIEFDALTYSIREKGLQESIVINHDGVILDGYTRYEICRNLGITPTFITKSFENKDQELQYVLEVNATRRQLNNFQRIELFIDIFKSISEEAKKRHNNRRHLHAPQPSSMVRYSQIVGVGEATTQHAIRVLDSGREDLIQRCRNGTMTINSAYCEVHKDIISKAWGGRKKYPPVKLMLKFFEDSPLKAELERIVDVYNKGKAIPSQ